MTEKPAPDSDPAGEPETTESTPQDPETETMEKAHPRQLKWMGRVYLIALGILAFDQLTKWIIASNLEFRTEEINVIDGFFRLVHWGNTGSAFSMFSGNNGALAAVALIALVGMFFVRHHFEVHRPLGRWAMGVITGGIIGNLIDRIIHNHVIDFLYFYTYRRMGEADPYTAMEIGFPAFNVADAAICTGIGLVFLMAARDGRIEALEAEKKNLTEEASIPNNS